MSDERQVGRAWMSLWLSTRGTLPSSPLDSGRLVTTGWEEEMTRPPPQSGQGRARGAKSQGRVGLRLPQALPATAPSERQRSLPGAVGISNSPRAVPGISTPKVSGHSPGTGWHSPGTGCLGDVTGVIFPRATRLHSYLRIRTRRSQEFFQ